MQRALIAAIVLAALIVLAPRGQGEQNFAQRQTQTQNQLAPPSGQVHAETEAGAAKNNPERWYKSPEWVLVIVGAITAFVIGWQAWETRRSAGATRIAAEAAKASADAAISAERAWIMVDLERVPGIGGPVLRSTSIEKGTQERHLTIARIRCVCSNQGKTPAKILEKRAALVLITPSYPLPPIPNLDIEIQDGVPHYLQSRDVFKGEWTPSTVGAESMGAFLVVYGVIRYRHLFSEREVRTTFGYRITVDDRLERLTDYPKYNENT